MDLEGSVYALIYAILYRRLKHPRILMSGGLEPDPHRYPETTEF